MPLKFYTDTHIDKQVAIQLRQNGVEVIRCEEVGMVEAIKALNHIDIRDGEGFISGRNLKAKMVARMHLWENRAITEVMEHYDLTAAEVHAALAFYYDNRERLDQEYAAALDVMREVGTSTDEFRRKIEARKHAD